MSPTTANTWQFTEHTRETQESFTYDDMINAYLKGKEEATKENLAAIKKLLLDNLKKAGEQTSEIITELKNKDIEVRSALLKIHNWNEVEVLLIVPQDNYIDPHFLEAYDLITKFEKEFYEEEIYSITFSFVDDNDYLDKDKIESDGFILEHKMNQS